MIILGIDPGTTSIGFAVISANHTPTLRASGLFSITSKGAPERLAELKRELDLLIKKWKPVAVSLERLFFAKNAKTAIAVSEARGVILLTTALARVIPYEYTPLEVKKIITGDGRADKTQLQKMIRLTLPETAQLKARDDVFDAIALALACFYGERRTLSSQGQLRH